MRRGGDGTVRDRETEAVNEKCLERRKRKDILKD